MSFAPAGASPGLIALLPYNPVFVILGLMLITWIAFASLSYLPVTITSWPARGSGFC